MVKASKKPKTVVKTILDNPFFLKWPVIEEELLNDVKVQLEASCVGLGIPLCKPPWGKVRKWKGEARLKYCQQYREDFLGKLLSDPDSAKSYKLAKEGRSHLILGYNAVMKSLEQNKLAGILIKREVEPLFLGQTFLPGCMSKHVPLVPVKGLDSLLKKEETLAVKHSVMVLGLKPSVRESTCRFHPLYESMARVLRTVEKTSDFVMPLQLAENVGAEVVGDAKEFSTKNVNVIGADTENRREDGVECLQSSENVSDKVIDERMEVDAKVEEKNVFKSKLSLDEIKAYHLKRSTPSKRAFVPPTKKAKSDVLEEIIDLEPSEVPVVEVEDESSKKGYSEGLEELADLETSEVSALRAYMSKKVEDVDFQFGFYMDTTGDGGNMADLESEETNVKGKAKKEKTVKDDVPAADYSYVPAQAKRVKSNPNRVTKKAKL